MQKTRFGGRISGQGVSSFTSSRNYYASNLRVRESGLRMLLSQTTRPQQ